MELLCSPILDERVVQSFSATLPSTVGSFVALVRNSPPVHCFRCKVCITKARDQIAAPSLCIGVFLLPKAMRPKPLLRAATNSLLVR
jgi:hypothetical protein